MNCIVANSRAIRELLDGADFSIDSCDHYLAKLRQQMQGLMRDLLTGRVRVDEIASASKT